MPEKRLLYAVVAHGTTVLCEFSDTSVGYSNVSQYTAQLLASIVAQPAKKQSYQAGE
jgi:hypothetical protein